MSENETMRRSVESALAAGRAPRIRYIRPLRAVEEATVIGANTLGVFYRDRRGLRHHVMWSAVTEVLTAA